jgi:hypothetical protein
MNAAGSQWCRDPFVLRGSVTLAMVCRDADAGSPTVAPVDSHALPNRGSSRTIRRLTHFREDLTRRLHYALTSRAPT